MVVWMVVWMAMWPQGRCADSCARGGAGLVLFLHVVTSVLLRSGAGDIIVLIVVNEALNVIVLRTWALVLRDPCWTLLLFAALRGRRSRRGFHFRFDDFVRRDDDDVDLAFDRSRGS